MKRFHSRSRCWLRHWLRRCWGRNHIWDSATSSDVMAVEAMVKGEPGVCGGDSGVESTTHIVRGARGSWMWSVSSKEEGGGDSGAGADRGVTIADGDGRVQGEDAILEFLLWVWLRGDSDNRFLRIRHVSWRFIDASFEMGDIPAISYSALADLLALFGVQYGLTGLSLSHLPLLSTTRGSDFSDNSISEISVPELACV